MELCLTGKEEKEEKKDNETNIETILVADAGAAYDTCAIPGRRSVNDGVCRYKWHSDWLGR